MEPPDQHGAGAAIALRTALFGPFETALEAKEVEQSVARSCLADARLAIVQKEAYFAAIASLPDVGVRLPKMREAKSRSERGTVSTVFLKIEAAGVLPG
jgi:hypothetical protein